MKIAVVTGLLTEWDMKIDAGHAQRLNAFVKDTEIFDQGITDSVTGLLKRYDR
ncbi:hypothetical protein ACFQ1M_16725 [Sungkyunkwania multivorans]|uniref:Uncharacterized protein n=1 Tax=Sungkyunkwania multivorans TaxID=1173618 RepID=A0ABW3D322_9FLAO